MSEEIVVRVEGPTLLRSSLCFLLNSLPNIAAIGAPGDSHYEKIELGIRGPYVHLLIAVGGGGVEASQPTGLARRRTALLLDGREPDLIQYCAHQSEVFIHLDDDLQVLHAALLAAARAEPFCSPALTSRLMGDRDRSPARTHDPDRAWNSLSVREREVARLVASGMSNLEVAVELFVTVSTVKAHLTEVYRKLGICRRSQIGLSLSPYNQGDLTSV